MKTNQMKTRWIVWAGLGIAFLGQCVNAATFPQKPLQVGQGGAAPNIMFILDDSGSMQSVSMGKLDANGADISNFPDEVVGYNSNPLGDSPADRSYLNNSIYYNPAKTYLPWRTASTTLTDRMPNASISAAVANTRFATGTPVRNLCGNSDGVFYVPNVGVTTSTTASDFTRYWIDASCQVVTAGSTPTRTQISGFPKTGLKSSMDADTERTFSVTVPAGTTLIEAATTGGGTGVKLNIVDPWGSTSCTSSSGNNSESCSVTNPSAGTWQIQVYRDNSATFTGVNLDAYITSLPPVAQIPRTSIILDQSVTPNVNRARTQAEEVQNFANWYQYHRTRTKVAKAGASEAFGKLGSNFRVGFDTIWNRGTDGNSIGVAGSAPVFPIPTGNNGKFGDVTGSANRSDWYSRLQGAGASSGTPLHGALQRAGRYYQTAQPWKDSSDGAEVECRQSYAILTTDGMWNVGGESYDRYGNVTSDGGYRSNSTPAIADNDGDNVSQTLADVAMAYYKNDLRPALANKVPTTTGKDENNFQHMVTFGVSIGLKGTRDITDPPPTTWPNPWQTSGTGTGNSSNGSLLWGNESNRRIDDLWHAAVNSKGSFIVASDSQAFASALESALQTIQNRDGSSGNLAGNGAELTSGSRVYQGVFTANVGKSIWTGDLKAYDISGTTLSQVWNYGSATNAGAATYKDGLILTSVGGAAKLFTQNATNGLTDVQLAPLARSTGNATVSLADNLAYLRGNGSKEKGQPNGTLRARDTPVGDIINSSPIYVPETETLYVGANDGFLHAIKASDGTPLFRYLPKGTDLADLAKLSDPGYVHRYFMDGQIDVGNKKASINNDTNFLVGAMGRGGKGVFLLDVTNPVPYSNQNRTGMDASKVLWDTTFQDSFTTGKDDDMGFVLGQPIIRMGENGATLVVVPNGTDSVTNKAVLIVYILDASGAVTATKKFPVGTTDNALMNIGVGDLNGNGKLDVVYGGDLKGNLWKWDLSSADPATWATAFSGTPLFVAKDGTASTANTQPITGGIALARDPGTQNVFVVFGTGRYLTDGTVTGTTDDRLTTTTQTMYGIIDGTTAIANGRDDLQRRTFPRTGTDALGRPARAGEAWAPLGTDKRGWYLDLGVPTTSARGERVITRPVVFGRALWFTTLIPNSSAVCDTTGSSGYLNAADVFTGTSPGSASDTYSYIDVSNPESGTDNHDRLSGQTSGNDNLLISVDVGLGGLGTPRVTNTKVCVGGFDASGNCINTNGGGSGVGAARIMWRELIEGY